ncbi:hypothetical protein EVG20_g4771 [Dentipellis fragilis]|uniref:N-acetyltransferase domain-containing protein n=1 Tax=Dentipellis fragilis TaxID=205917 RepID=A0A4Y9YVH4_9AGAM|nr:hypothetical protein EVG20_g4771 [Dentipellis fragilis]
MRLESPSHRPTNLLRSLHPHDPSMLDYNVRLAEDLTPDQIDEMVAICLRSFDTTDVVSDAFTGSNPALLDPSFRCTIRAGIHRGTVYLAQDKSDRILAFAVCFGPGKSMYSTQEQGELGFDQMVSDMSPETRDWWKNTYAPKVNEILSEEVLGVVSKLPGVGVPRHLLSLHTQNRVDAWYVNLLVADSAFKRQGLARAVLDAVDQRAIADKTVLVLCANKEINRDVYLRLRFQVKGQVDVPSPAGTVPVFALTRTPASGLDPAKAI